MKKIAVVTTGRADYGLLKPVIRQILDSASLELHLLVSGSHLDERFGRTVQEIEADGFPIARRIEILTGSGTALDTTRSVARGMDRFASAFSEISPDLVLLLGDRAELLGIAGAALILNIPIAHIHGGEVTSGAIDDSIRHAISKMATFHFVAHESYKKRLLQMGENEQFVFVTGSPAIDGLLSTVLPDRAFVCETCGIDPRAPFALLTWHPVTRAPAETRAGLEAITEVLLVSDRLNLVVTSPNFDTGHETVISALQDLVRRAGARASYVPALGHTNYLAAAREAEFVIGNSSSGLIEVPALGTPVVNVGTRQMGRLRPPGVLDCEATGAAIAAALHSLGQSGRQEYARDFFGDGHAAESIVDILERTILDDLPPKIFVDR